MPWKTRPENPGRLSRAAQNILKKFRNHTSSSLTRAGGRVSTSPFSFLGRKPDQAILPSSCAGTRQGAHPLLVPLVLSGGPACWIRLGCCRKHFS